MRLSIFVVLISVAFCAAQSPVRYTISFPNRVHHEAEVSVTFIDLPGTTLEILMSGSSPGTFLPKTFARNVYDVRAVDRNLNRLKVVRVKPYQWNISNHGGQVSITYTDFGDQVDGANLAVDASHAHINMPATFMWARGLKDRSVEIRFERPATDWSIATQLVPTERSDTYTAPDLPYFMDSPTEISDFDLREWTIESKGKLQTIRLALHHEGTPEEVDAFMKMAQAVVQEQIAVFGEAPMFDYGDYIFIADYLPYASGGGMEHRNSTFLYGKRQLSEGPLVGTLAHEFFHTWNVERIRPRSIEPWDFEHANFAGEYWFAEGFTDYYTDLTLRRARIISLDNFTRRWRWNLRWILNTPGRRFHGPIEMSQLMLYNFFSDEELSNSLNVYADTYAYGKVLALALDLNIRIRFDALSLDNFMRMLWHKYGKTEFPYTIPDLQSALAEVTKDPVFAEDFFSTYIYGPDLPDFKKLLAPAGLRLRRTKKDSAWIEIRGLSFKDNVAKLKSPPLAGSPLYESGLDRRDMILTVEGDSVKVKGDLLAIIRSHQPGDTVRIVYERNGKKDSTDLIFQEDPDVEVVPFEHIGKEVTEEIKTFRESWLGSKSDFPKSQLVVYCHECNREYPMEYQFCRFDGEKLKITPKDVIGID
jgi:predicted metalloprotease with PDZ domain